MKSRIMIVDDTPANLRLLEQMLQAEGYDVFVFLQGPMALRAAKRNPPDLILLDINMPDMDGYAVCAKLKADETLRDIPVLFVSAYTETEEKLRAFEAGGVDYVTKPFHIEEVTARVRTHLSILELQRQLKANYEELEALQEFKENLVHMLVHDMRSPLMGITGFAELLLGQTEPPLSEKASHFGQMILQNGRSLYTMVNDLLDVTRLEEGRMPIDAGVCSLAELSEEAFSRLGALTAGREYDLQVIDAGANVLCDTDLTVRAIANLLDNAFKFTPTDGVVRVQVRAAEGYGQVSVRDEGAGISDENLDRIFEKFGQVDIRQQGVRHSTGLGLTFVKLAVEAQGGTVRVESTLGEGSTFTIQLPAGH